MPLIAGFGGPGIAPRNGENAGFRVFDWLGICWGHVIFWDGGMFGVGRRLRRLGSHSYRLAVDLVPTYAD